MIKKERTEKKNCRLDIVQKVFWTLLSFADELNLLCNEEVETIQSYIVVCAGQPLFIIYHYPPPTYVAWRAVINCLPHPVLEDNKYNLL